MYEAYAMVMTTYGWGRYLSNATLLDLQDNSNAQSWINNQKGHNYAAGLFMLACSRRLEERDCFGLSERVDTADNTFADALSGLFKAWEASWEAYKVFEFVTRYMPGTLVVQDTTIMVELVREQTISDKKLDNDDKVLTANTVNSFQRAWAPPERANNVPHFLLHHDYFNLLRGACAQH